MNKGKFITFEGGEAAGKSTQAKLLADWLGNRSQASLITREPGGSPLAEKIRTLLLRPEGGPPDALTEALLFNAARRDHLTRVVLPALSAGTHVISDRFADSTRAYQGAGGRLDAVAVDTLERMVVGDNWPDLTVILDLPVEVGLERAAVRHAATGGASGRDRFEAEAIDFHKRLREAFMVIAAREPRRCAFVDARPDAETVAAEIRKLAAERLGL
jgi:dTMP kinase